MNEKMYWACADVLTLATQIAGATELPAPDGLARRIASLFEQMAAKAREAGINDADVTDVRYALAAFIDEQILRSAWPGRMQWMSRPLQLVYFNENSAGEGFFQRLEGLENQPGRAHVLEIYYLCLALGFQGRFAVQGGEGLAALTENIGAKVARSLPSAEVISPHGEPADPRRSFVRGEAPIVALSVGFFVLALLVYGTLFLVLRSDVSDATQTMNAAAGPGAPAASARPRP